MKQVVIIGAGPAGITAAYELLSKSEEYRVIILEQSNEAGGISRTVRHNGNRMDIGGHRFFSKDKRVTEWWEKMMPLQGAPSFDDKLLGREKPLSDGGPNPETTDEVMLVRRRVSRIYYLKKFFDYPISMKLQTFKNMGLVRTTKAGFSYMKSAVFKRREKSLEDFYINRFGQVLYGMFFEGYTEKLWGRHPSGLSADWGAQRVKSLSVTAVLKDMFKKMLPKSKKSKQNIETSLIEEFVYPKFGPGQLWETAVSRVEEKGGTVKKNCRVVSLQSSGNKISGVTYEENGQQHTLDADIVISSMPLKDLAAGLGEVVPENIAAIADGLPYRDFVTVGLLLSELRLKNQTNIKTLGDIVPDCWIYVQDTDVKLGRIQIFNNWSPYMVSEPQKNVWIGLEYFCDEGDDFWSMSDDECIAFATEELIRMGLIENKDVVRDSHRERVQKAYPAYFDTYAQIDGLINFLNGIENLYCVGRNGQHRYNNMDHSMVTSFETVSNILQNRTDKSNVWSVNTDKEYHEKTS